MIQLKYKFNITACKLLIIFIVVIFIKSYLNLEFGRSGNKIIDEFIIEKKLKWISYNNFRNVEYLNEGEYSTIYKAIWLNNDGDREVILKCRNNFNENLNEFLNEWKYHESCLDSYDIISFYGFTKSPDNYMAVMDYANKGNLRENLPKIIKNDWKQKLYMLHEIISGLNTIHNQNLIHCDFHDGNILNHNDDNKEKIYICDFRLCQPVKSSLKKNDIYGVIPFMAPEEFTSGVPPFNNRAHDLQISLSICKGKRPEIIENTPQCYVDLMNKCWNEDPLKRPSSKEVLNIIIKWIFLPYRKKAEDIDAELKCNVMEFISAPIGHNNLTTKSHPQAYYKSRFHNFTSKELNKILESEDSQ
ncbi:kinase-like domain-containing protein [Rhizophagus irregularis DAOM 181602=DAOM 197198]|nr:kinase-like domain-containing protein [Rhizophagus irregularis DAOM 181602=DAOM 197198]